MGIHHSLLYYSIIMSAAVLLQACSSGAGTPYQSIGIGPLAKVSFVESTPELGADAQPGIDIRVYQANTRCKIKSQGQIAPAATARGHAVLVPGDEYLYLELRYRDAPKSPPSRAVAFLAEANRGYTIEYGATPTSDRSGSEADAPEIRIWEGEPTQPVKAIGLAGWDRCLQAAAASERNHLPTDSASKG